MVTDQDQTVVNTDAAGKDTADTDIVGASGATDHTVVADPTGVADPTEEDSKEEDEDEANVTERLQKGKDCRSV